MSPPCPWRRCVPTGRCSSCAPRSSASPRAEADELLNDRLELGLEPDSVDGLVERTTAPGTRRSLYRQIQQGLNARGPFIPLIQPTQVFAATSDLAGAVFSGAYDVDVTHVSPK